MTEVAETDSILFHYTFDGPPDSPINNSTPSSETKTIRIHRGHIFEEFLKLADEICTENSNLKIEMVLPSGELEYAEDFGGVFRDALSEFWQCFYEKCTVGSTYKVPYIRHDFGESQWNAIAKVYVKGFRSERYIPLKLAPVFIRSCFGFEIEDSKLIEDFLNFLCEAEADIIKKSLNDLHSVELDDILDVLTSYDSKWTATESNIKQLIRDIAHQELVQKPAFVVRCFNAVFLTNQLNYLDVIETYTSISPTVKNCLSKIVVSDSEDITLEKTVIFGYLKKIIKESDEKHRMLFFRYATGSDLPIRDISVSFTDAESEVTRVPVAHTCTGLLEIPKNYENYVVFRSEINSLLNSKIWVMDIV